MHADDHRLIAECLQGRTAAFGELVRRYQDRLYNTVYRLVDNAEDAQDANLPLMLWYGVEPLAAADPARAAQLLVKSRMPLVRRHIARRIAALAE